MPRSVDPRALTARPLMALALLAPLPTLGVLSALVMLPGPVGQSLYLGAKIWILALPLLWWLAVEKQRVSFSPLQDRRGLSVGLLSGLVLGGVVFGAAWLLGDVLVDRESLREIVAKNQLDRWPRYLGLALALSFGNALAEEYIWRWFVYSQAAKLTGERTAIVVSALLFTLHHTVALGLQFGITIAILGSIGVFVGGLIWSALYRRYDSVWPGYVSHILTDFGVFGAGALLIFG